MINSPPAPDWPSLQRIKLEPCPHCGAVAKMYPTPSGGRQLFTVACENSFCPALTRGTPADAAGAWNQRAGRPAPTWPQLWRDLVQLLRNSW